LLSRFVNNLHPNNMTLYGSVCVLYGGELNISTYTWSPCKHMTILRLVAHWANDPLRDRRYSSFVCHQLDLGNWLIFFAPGNKHIGRPRPLPNPLARVN
jgi:hypothetical protein